MLSLDSKPIVFIGYDKREDASYRSCVASLYYHATVPIDVVPLDQDTLRQCSLYRRGWFVVDGQPYDNQDQKPFSTEFSFSRFLSPVIGRILQRKYAMFVDSDFMFRDDVNKLFSEIDPGSTVSVVKHNYKPVESTKLRGNLKQEAYNRKLWSALMIFNTESPDVRALTTYQVNFQPGSWLHGFQWTDEKSIGALPHEWHWIPGHSPDSLNPKAVHYTLGTPDVDGHEFDPYADEWRAFSMVA